ncbi:MAG: hypothetical protein M0P43_07810 [Arcobacteraceae bacterium]|jgi:hypothetical protein|nr:hypothetical protein [Arcobacteraceae bacterium]MDY0328008.1 hypothetical protein [Arcobacteraceae bacterium]
MKNLLFVIFLLFMVSGCTQKEIVTTKYYENFSKDDVLLAAKRAFLITQGEEYVVDSYRDRLEVTKIGLFYHLVGNKIVIKEYLLNVEEDDLGVNAKMTIIGSYDMDKKGKYYVDTNEHNFIWDKIDFFLNQSDALYIDANHYTKNTPLNDSYKVNIGGYYSDKVIVSSKKEKQNQEFENGMINPENKTIESSTIIQEDSLQVEEIGHDDI